MSIASAGNKRTRSERTLICPAAAAGTGARGLLRSAGAVTPIPTRCRFACIAYLAPAIAPGARFSSVHARDRPSHYGSPTGVRCAGAVTPIPTRCRFACIAYLAPAIAPGARFSSVHARDRPSHYGHRGALFFRSTRGTGPRTTGTRARFFFGAREGQALALRAPGRAFFVMRGTGPRDRFLILDILTILAILLQTQEILIKIISFFTKFVKLFFIDFGILAASDSEMEEIHESRSVI